MDLGLQGKTALVCASSKGLGYSCALALAQEGVALTMVARGTDALEAAAEAVRAATGMPVRTVSADIASAEGRARVLAACPAPDILVNNAGGPKPGDFRDWSRDDWLAALDANMLAPIEMIKGCVDGMMARGFGRIVNITSSAVKAPIDILGLSNGARSGLTGFVAGLARKTAIRNVTLNNLLPGPFATGRLEDTLRASGHMSGRSYEDVVAEWQARNPTGRFGEPMEFGRACAFMCSAHAGFINGQNLLLDGGAYPGTF
ncbi:MAG TPA: SDR family oxidoreductase [Variovorax sp.]|nr:SDR family oxidoreductase [Variovorax sp.]